MKRIAITILLSVLSVLYAGNGLATWCESPGLGMKNSAMISRYLHDLADNSSGFAVVRSIGTTSGTDGNPPREISAILITENASWDHDRGRPTVIITGAIHGNEWATPEVCIGIAEYLLDNKDNFAPALDAKGELINSRASLTTVKGNSKEIVPRLTSIGELLRKIQVIIIPVYNPEGYDYSQTPEGKMSYYGAGWRPNRRKLARDTQAVICYRRDGTLYPAPPADAEHCFLADYDDTASGGEVEEESVIVCESMDGKTLSLFEPSLSVASTEMFDAIYDSRNPKRVVCASGQRRVWKEQWSSDDQDRVSLARAKKEGYLRVAFGTDINRNFQYKWDVTDNQKHLFIRTRSPSSRMYRGPGSISEPESGAMERLIAKKNVIALIDYHAGSTQVLYPYAYSTRDRVNKNILDTGSGRSDYEIFHAVSEKIAAILNRYGGDDKSITGYTAAQNYNKTSVGSGVARDCYYQTEGIAALNIEVHDRRYTYGEAEFEKVVPAICRTNVPGAIWFLFWAADLAANR
ncbi:MAG TPA: hypothetical protein ENI89_07495 [Desulfobulbus sp.]|nr:hypothetical protein [Desulfobulbus sp.]